MTLKILSESPINSYQLKEELSKIKKRDKELNFRAQKTEDHLSQASTHKNVGQIFEKINKLGIQRLREHQIHKIIDVMPITVKDLKVVLQGYNVSVSNENMAKVIEIINEAIDK